VIATSFALLAFAAVVAVGVASEVPAGSVLWRATLAMLVCWPIGRIVGDIAMAAVGRSVDRYRAEHPLPENESEPAGAGETPAPQADAGRRPPQARAT
jgi:hypothetical protein